MQISIPSNIFQQCDLVKKIRDNCRKYYLMYLNAFFLKILLLFDSKTSKLSLCQFSFPACCFGKFEMIAHDNKQF